MTITIWARPFSGDATMTYFAAEFFAGWETYSATVCEEEYEIPHYGGAVDFWLTPCGALALDVGSPDQRLVSSTEATFFEWSHFGFVLSSTFLDSTVNIFLNSASVGTATFNDLVYSSADKDTYIGSYTDWVYSFHGFMYNWAYWQYARISLVD
jgi:hypothetical protein